MGWNFGHWLSGAAKAVGGAIQHAATGITDIAKAIIHQPIALAHELSGAVTSVAHELGGTARSLGHSADDALKGVSSNLTMPLLVAGGAALVFMMTQRR
jgi:ABC-type Fe3+ transport system permease subunit